MCFIFKSLKWSRVLLPTDGWPAYVRWQKLYGRKPRQAGQGLEKLSELPPLLEHSTFPPSSLGRPQLTINSWCTLQNCFISLRNDELQRSVAIVSHSLEDGYSWDFSPMLTLRLANLQDKYITELQTSGELLGSSSSKAHGLKMTDKLPVPIGRWE